MACSEGGDVVEEPPNNDEGPEVGAWMVARPQKKAAAANSFEPVHRPISSPLRRAFLLGIKQVLLTHKKNLPLDERQVALGILKS